VLLPWRSGSGIWTVAGRRLGGRSYNPDDENRQAEHSYVRGQMWHNGIGRSSMQSFEFIGKIALETLVFSPRHRPTHSSPRR
jgi:hypothetical protein